MKNSNHIFFILISLSCGFLGISTKGNAQIEDILVEQYYVSDSKDSTHIDDKDGILAEGSSTYRVFVDLEPGYKVKEIFATPSFPLSIASTGRIWNNEDRGETFGFDIRTSRLDEATVPLDSWLTIGLAFAGQWGIPKSLDSDGSIVGGENNDGGSKEIEGGLLTNAPDSIGLPLTTADGLLDAGDFDPTFTFNSSSDPEVVLADETVDSSFFSDNLSFSIDSAVGDISEENYVLLAQITTKGELSFSLNITLLDAEGNEVQLVSSEDTTGQNTTAIFSPLLSFPRSCGCTDPDFLEYKPTAGCDDGSCKTAIVLGCLDPLACNFNPDANTSLETLCCYPGNCIGGSFTNTCPVIGLDEELNESFWMIYPNPSDADITVAHVHPERVLSIEVFDARGQNISSTSGIEPITFLSSGGSVKNLPSGLYTIRLLDDSGYSVKQFVKK